MPSQIEFYGGPKDGLRDTDYGLSAVQFAVASETSGHEKWFHVYAREGFRMVYRGCMTLTELRAWKV